jgi:hypothetical protein
MSKPFAFFDVDCRHPDQTNTHFVFAEKIAGFRGTVESILVKSEMLGAPILATVCLGIQRVNPEMSVKTVTQKIPDTAFVALNASQQDAQQAARCRQIFLERHACSSPEENLRQCSNDVFRYNANAATIVRALGDRHWLVFGAGFQYCVASTVEGLLKLGFQVTVLEDALLPAYGSAQESFAQTVEQLKSLGAKFADFYSVFRGGSA